MDAISKLLGTTDLRASTSSSISSGGNTTRRNLTTSNNSRFSRSSNYGNNRRPWARQPSAASAKAEPLAVFRPGGLSGVLLVLVFTNPVAVLRRYVPYTDRWINAFCMIFHSFLIVLLGRKVKGTGYFD
ncbi:hypothetical protein PoB_005622400 [Plakobranchus ocellatus]|uniref:Uncharacterized protein n=1 Tax=Plakobranchus ocellatus TaxID=259542 RepID=A0AAV4CAX0_9GAST|nr:hypothetical protein PoB_005622400 [Plakobranchus ocellatus]